MRSGEKIGEKLKKLDEKVAHLTQLTGAEYFYAVIALDDIAAAVARRRNSSLGQKLQPVVALRLGRGAGVAHRDGGAGAGEIVRQR